LSADLHPQSSALLGLDGEYTEEALPLLIQRRGMVVLGRRPCADTRSAAVAACS